MNHRPLSHRAFRWLEDHLSLPPVASSVLLSLLLGGFAFWVTWIGGVVDAVAAGLQPDIALRAPIILYVMLGYLPVAIFYLDRWTTEHLGQLRRHFGLTATPTVIPRGLARWIGAAGALVTCAFFMNLPDDPWLLLQPWRLSITYLMPLVGVLLLGWFNFRFTFLLIWTALAVSRTAGSIRDLDLFDPAGIRPYAQQGVRSCLLAIVSLSISANLWLDPRSPTLGAAISVIMLVAASAVALVLPTGGIHLRLKAAKQFELDRIRRAIVSRRDPETRSVDDAQQLRADLAMERRLDEISEWPFDAGSYGRVALYIVLGLGSWVGAALVEQLLDSLGS